MRFLQHRLPGVSGQVLVASGTEGLGYRGLLVCRRCDVMLVVVQFVWKGSESLVAQRIGMHDILLGFAVEMHQRGVSKRLLCFGSPFTPAA